MLANIYALGGLFAFIVGVVGSSVYIGGKLYKTVKDPYSDWEDYASMIFVLGGLLILSVFIAMGWPILIPIAIGFNMKKRKDVSTNRNDSNDSKHSHVDDIFGVFDR